MAATIMLPPKLNLAPGAVLNKALFVRSFDLVALRIRAQKCKFFIDIFRNVLLNMPKTRNVVPDAAAPPTAAKEVCEKISWQKWSRMASLRALPR